MAKIELNIIVQHLPDGQSVPRTIIWEDGRKFNIDKILDKRKRRQFLVVFDSFLFFYYECKL